MATWRWGALLVLLLHCASAADVPANSSLGVNWGMVASHMLPNKVVVDMIHANGITKVKMFDANNAVLEAFRGSSTELMIGVRNEGLKAMASSPDVAKKWVIQNVIPFLSNNSVNIRYVAVANEPFLSAYGDKYIADLYPALKNMATALEEAGLKDKIKVTVPFNADVVWAYSGVPSAGYFRQDTGDEMKKIVDLLAATGGPFVVNIYPFINLVMDPTFPPAFAYFDGISTPTYDGNLTYTNSFDAAHDLVLAALARAGHPDMELIIGEVGWPTDGHPVATPEAAQRFVGELAKHVRGGTPQRPNVTVPTYIFGLLDEDLKTLLPGNFEPHWGIFTFDGQPKFDVDLSGGDAPNAKLVGAQNVKYLPKRWCVLDESKSDSPKLGKNIDFACKNNSACTSLAYGSSCGNLSLEGKASYAFNSYFQLNNQLKHSCFFDGLSVVTSEQPSFGNCTFSVQLDSGNTTSNVQRHKQANNTKPHSASTPLSPGGALLLGMLLAVSLLL